MEVTTVDFSGWSFLQGPSIDAVATHICSTKTRVNGKLPIVFTPNAYILTECFKRPEVAKSLAQSAFILPDGQPLVWLSKNIRKRWTGADIFHNIWTNGLIEESTALLISPSQDVSKAFSSKHPNAQVITAPMLSTPKEIAAYARTLVSIVNDNNVQHVFVHLGFPKQEQVAIQLMALLEKNVNSSLPTVYCFGAALEFYTQSASRAPQWMQKFGLEWFFRLLSEPRRLLKRYLIDSPQLVWYVLRRKRLAK